MNVLFKVAGVLRLIALVGMSVFFLLTGQNALFLVAAVLLAMGVLNLCTDEIAVGVVTARLFAVRVLGLLADKHLARLVAGVSMGVLLLAAHERERDAGIRVHMLGLAAECLVAHGDACQLERPRHNKGHDKREAREDGEDTPTRHAVMKNRLEIPKRALRGRTPCVLHVFTSLRPQHGSANV